MFYKAYPLEKLKEMRVSKRELVKMMLIEDITFDYALPQNWLDDFVDGAAMKIKFPRLSREEVYSLVLSTTVWVYPKGSTFGHPISGCTEIATSLPAIGITSYS